MLLTINQDLRTTTIIVWKERAYPILENVMLQKKKSLQIFVPILFQRFLLGLFFLFSFAHHGKSDTKHRYTTRFLKNR